MTTDTQNTNDKQRRHISAAGAKSHFKPFPAHIRTNSRFSHFDPQNTNDKVTSATGTALSS